MCRDEQRDEFLPPMGHRLTPIKKKSLVTTDCADFTDNEFQICEICAICGFSFCRCISSVFICAKLNDLFDFQLDDRARVEVDSAFEVSSQSSAIERDDPSFFDDHVFDDSASRKRCAADRSILSLRRSVRDELVAPLFGENLCK